jgi:hypothetical protein
VFVHVYARKTRNTAIISRRNIGTTIGGTNQRLIIWSSIVVFASFRDQIGLEDSSLGWTGFGFKPSAVRDDVFP